MFKLKILNILALFIFYSGLMNPQSNKFIGFLLKSKIKKYI